ncbi:hypothetical protein C1646_725994 [Rhizophagus diaphanus]|nr:hypothetical protein C1646_725994 [Rhizophagus diaphanus] [Rhizophagus sp. MUCL 43196]
MVSRRVLPYTYFLQKSLETLRPISSILFLSFTSFPGLFYLTKKKKFFFWRARGYIIYIYMYISPCKQPCFLFFPAQFILIQHIPSFKGSRSSVSKYLQFIL